jgi:O-antigen/teichoic acid export membrane protein
MSATVREQTGEDPSRDAANSARRKRKNRIKLAWGTSLGSTATTIAVQGLAVPLVYRSLGHTGYAAYAAITASAGLIGVLNLGIGGSLVTPIAAAAVEGNESRQAVLVRAGLVPMIIICLIGAAVVIPPVAFLPLKTLFGRVGADGSLDLRVAALIAASVTLATIPLTMVDFLRQAFQEMHIRNSFGAASNILLLLTLMFAAFHSKAVAVFVAAFTLPLLAGRVANCGLFFAGRSYLLQWRSQFPWQESRQLLGDGIRFMSASFSSALVYQWPIYWVARVLSASQTAPFAISMQVVLFSLSFAIGFLQPIWSSTADANSRGDHAWLRRQLRKARITIALAGSAGAAVMLLCGQQMVQLWVHQPIAIDWQTRGLIGGYIILAMWEYLHFVVAMGLGQIRRATTAIFQRAAAFALAVPLLTQLGGPKALWCGMCCSVLLWTAWRLPKLMEVACAPSIEV